MASSTGKRLLTGLGILLAIWLGTKYLLPIMTPFLLGGLTALAAEPLVSFSQRRLKLPRGLAAGLGVSVTLLLLLGLLSMLGALILRELGQLAASVPDLESSAQQGAAVLQNWLVDMAGHAPTNIAPLLTRTVENVFDNGNVLMAQVTSRIPVLLTTVLSGVPDSALRLGTGLLAAFMISARLPRLRRSLTQRIPENWKAKYLPALHRTRKALGGWLRAQGMLALVTYGIVAVGFLLLRIPYGLFWALLIALVDAVPMLGTGLVLIPWALVRLLQGSQLDALLLMTIFAAATIARSTLEPKLVGKQLGLDPLLTLFALYVGYQIWGFLGLLAAPILTAAIKTFTETAAE